jgi:hypothetical protein
MIRVHLRDGRGVDHARLETALAKKLGATAAKWSDVANSNLLASVAQLTRGGPGWACEGPRFWGAVEKGAHEDADFFVGLRVGHDATRPPEVRDLARYGPNVVVSIVREYTPLLRGQPGIIVEMMAPGGDTEMRLGAVPQWRDLVLEPSVLTSPLAVFVASIGAALTFYSRTSKVPDALGLFAVGCALGAVAWLAAAKLAARKSKPRWERDGWEVS